MEEQIRQQKIDAEIARLKEKEGAEVKPEVEKPLLRKIVDQVGSSSSNGPSSSAAAATTLQAPIPAPRRDSRATPVQKPVVSVSETPHIEGVKTRNPKLASMMAMINSEDPKGGQMFAGQTMTPGFKVFFFFFLISSLL